MKYEIVLGEWDSFKNDKNEYDLIYLDPPFFTQRTHKMEKESGEVYFDDIWENLYEYNIWLKNVVETCWDKLSPTGMIYSHNNFEMNAYLLCSINEKIKNKFLTNISWQRSHPHNNIKKSWGNIVDSILVFSKTKDNFFNVQYSQLDEKYKNNSFNNKDEKGYYSLAPITGEKSRIGNLFEFNGILPKYGWRKSKSDIEKLHNEGLIHYGKNKPYKKMYLEESKGAPIQNIWTDIFPITRTEENKREYPTQKPIKLLERIIISSCPKDGKVLDPFGGSGTTLMASLKNKIPSYVKIIDKNPDSISIINENIKNL
jgi:site-specific DNA-methyltransferase (adenine-specific)/adenine-specific DNA-methyltransferase